MYETFATLQRFILRHMSSASTIGEIVELVGSFDKSWEDAAQTAVKEAVKTNNTVHFSKPPFYNIVPRISIALRASLTATRFQYAFGSLVD